MRRLWFPPLLYSKDRSIRAWVHNLAVFRAFVHCKTIRRVCLLLLNKTCAKFAKKETLSRVRHHNPRLHNSMRETACRFCYFSWLKNRFMKVRLEARSLVFFNIVFTKEESYATIFFWVLKNEQFPADVWAELKIIGNVWRRFLLNKVTILCTVLEQCWLYLGTGAHYRTMTGEPRVALFGKGSRGRTGTGFAYFMEERGWNLCVDMKRKGTATLRLYSRLSVEICQIRRGECSFFHRCAIKKSCCEYILKSVGRVWEIS